MVLLKFTVLLLYLTFIAYLHSTMVLLKSSKFSTVLLNIVTSTFHYGSIKILSKVLFLPPNVISTFHYGSIKI